MRGFGAISLTLCKVSFHSIMSERPYSPTNTDDEVHLRLRGNVEVASGTCSALEADLLLLLVKVLLCVLFSALEDDLALGLRVLNKESSQYNEL